MRLEDVYISILSHCDSTNLSIPKRRFFSFPKNPNFYKIWIENCGISDNKSARLLCIKHFGADSILKKKLRKEAISLYNLRPPKESEIKNSTSDHSIYFNEVEMGTDSISETCSGSNVTADKMPSTIKTYAGPASRKILPADLHYHAPVNFSETIEEHSVEEDFTLEELNVKVDKPVECSTIPNVFCNHCFKSEKNTNFYRRKLTQVESKFKKIRKQNLCLLKNV